MKRKFVKKILANNWYLLSGHFYFVKKTTEEGIVFVDAANPSHTFIRTGRKAEFFKRCAIRVEESEVYQGGEKNGNYI